MVDSAFPAAASLAAASVFEELRPDLLADLLGLLEQRHLRRGECLIRQGEPSDALHFVLSGRFTVHVEGVEQPIAEIAQGEPVGEIGFFAGLRRTATVVAARDSRVLTLDRSGFQQLTERVPQIGVAVIIALARRLATSTGRAAPAKQLAPIRTMALLPAGGSAPPQGFEELLRAVFTARSRTVFVTGTDVACRFGAVALDDVAISGWLDGLEAAADFIVYVADPSLTEWTSKCLRQADIVLLVARKGASTDLNAAERFAFAIHPPSARRLVILHEARTDVACGTAAWLGERDVFMHHHVALQDASDVERLHRFLSGRAVGFVAGGGGSAGSAHLGVYKAFSEAGTRFDILGGTSVGAAMMAGFACGADAERVDRGTHNIFIRSGAFRRPTLPRYGLLDHKTVDRALRAEYGDVLIEDLWRPFFAVSSNLSNNKPRIHRQGPLWQAVRASSSIPGALPPFFTPEGDMLVDGALMDNLPLVPMRALKAGPNVVVTFAAEGPTKYEVDYESLPGPAELAAMALNPFGRRRLPRAPGIVQVIALSMLANRRLDLLLGETDVLIRPKIPADLRFMEWGRHAELFRDSYEETAALIAERLASGDARVKAVIGAGA